MLAMAVVLAAAPVKACEKAVNVGVQQNAKDRIILHYELGDFDAETVKIDGEAYTRIVLGKESATNEAGAPELPNVCRSVIIPDDGKMAVEVLSEEYYDVEDVDVAPSRGPIWRMTNPDDVPYTFGKAYDTNAFFPLESANLGRPYILHDRRAVVVRWNPFKYNPRTRTLRVYTQVSLEVAEVGPGQINILQRKYRGGASGDSGRAPSDYAMAVVEPFQYIYQHHFLNANFADLFAEFVPFGNVDMLIICQDEWLPNIQPLVVHKDSVGIHAVAVGISTIGNDTTSIKDYIQDVYDANDLSFVLLVGDMEQITSPEIRVYNPLPYGPPHWDCPQDPTYAKLAGDDDYPDVIIGRFSAQNAAQVDTQVERTIGYETLPATDQAWFNRGTGIASNQGPGDDGEYDNQHMDNIRADLLGYGYTTVDQIYDYSGTAAQVTTALNAGRGIVNYCGHGSETSWSSTGFSNTHVNNLTNDNMLPFIFSVACLPGKFNEPTCFGEAWLRATHAGVPTGAVAAYMSSRPQHWCEPMCAQDEFNDLLVAEAHASFGELCFAGSCQMMDEYGASGVEMFDTWTIFGDPSVRVVPEPPSEIFIPPFDFEIAILEPWPWPEPIYATGDVEILHGAVANEAILTPVPEPGAVFSHWEGDVPAGHESDNPLTLVLTRDVAVRPVFKQASKQQVDPMEVLNSLDCGAGMFGMATLTMVPLMLAGQWRMKRRTASTRGGRA